MRRESHVRFCERLKAKFLGPTHQIKGVWKYSYRAVAKQGKTVDLMLTAKRDAAASRCFLDKPMKQNGTPDKVTMDKSGAHKAVFDALNAGRDVPFVQREVKYLNNIVQ